MVTTPLHDICICYTEKYYLFLVASAVLHRFEEVPVFSLDFASLNADISAKTMEEACVHIISEARHAFFFFFS